VTVGLLAWARGTALRKGRPYQATLEFPLACGITVGTPVSYDRHVTGVSAVCCVCSCCSSCCLSYLRTCIEQRIASKCQFDVRVLTGIACQQLLCCPAGSHPRCCGGQCAERAAQLGQSGRASRGNQPLPSRATASLNSQPWLCRCDVKCVWAVLRRSALLGSALAGTPCWAQLLHGTVHTSTHSSLAEAVSAGTDMRTVVSCWRGTG
jgi:hypothetical protein